MSVRYMLKHLHTDIIRDNRFSGNCFCIPHFGISEKFLLKKLLNAENICQVKYIID